MALADAEDVGHRIPHEDSARDWDCAWKSRPGI